MKACGKCSRRRALANSAWCRLCWQVWYFTVAINTIKVKD